MTAIIRIQQSTTPKVKPPQDQLGFGVHFTDHMFIMDYSTSQGWYDPRIIPYQPLVIDPSAKVFHYGQAIFEGLKAYKTSEGKVQLFRPCDNIERLNRSNERMSIPKLDVETAISALKQLVELDADWIPTLPGTSLYIRPFVIATQASLGLSPSEQYQFIIIMTPVGAYYREGINPLKIFVETHYVRAVNGGVGEAKVAGNYAASLRSQQLAQEQGYSQVMWLDGVFHQYIEEVGSMNVFFVINGKVITPALNGSILAGITRNSVIQLLKHWGITVEERRISIDEIFEAGRDGSLKEIFGTGTAAIISPVSVLGWSGEQLVIGEGRTGTLTERIYDTITGIQNGTVEDVFDWVVEV